MKNLFIFLFAAALAWGCSSDGAKISGRLIGNSERKVYLEQTLPASQTLIDSTSTDKQGGFTFKVKLPEEQPTLYNIICDNDKIPLLLAAGEKVELHAIGAISRNYTVEGSDGSEKIRELKGIFDAGRQRLDSLSVCDPVDPAQREELKKKYATEYIKIKQDHIAFIRMNTGSLASLYALYQRIPGDPYLSNGENDFIYYRMVADSLGQKYPSSPYVAALQKEVARTEKDRDLATALDRAIAEGGVGYIDLDLPDIYGQRHTLSATQGKVVLVCFWLAEANNSGILNAELKELYDRYAGSGFDIYQISLDQNKSTWIEAVQGQRPQWTSVRDENGAEGMAVRNFHVTDLPSFFLIDKEGNVAARDLQVDALDGKVAELLK